MAEKWPSLEDLGASEICEKLLSASDTRGAGTIEIPKAQAIKILEAAGKDVLQFDCKDSFGNVHIIKWSAWSSAQSQTRLLEGTQELQETYGLGMGDSLVFGQLASGELVACGKLGPGRRLPASQPAADKIVVTLDRSRRKRRTNTPYDPSDEGGRTASQTKPRKHGERKADPQDDTLLARADGVFRAISSSESESSPAGIVSEEHGFWAASFDAAGETYKAFFPNNEDAQEALLAAIG